MSGAPETASRPVIATAEPQLFVVDVTASAAYFVEKLGFRIVFLYGTPPYYAQVARDNASINLRCVKSPVIDARLRDSETLLSASLTVASTGEIDALHDELQAAGALIAERLTDQPWGARTFIIRDLDGNLVLFAGPAPKGA